MITEFKNFIYLSTLKIILNFGVDEGNDSVMSIIKADFFRCTALDDINELLKFILSDPGFKFIFFFRLSSLRPKSKFRKRIHAFSFYFHKKYLFKYGYQIPVSTNIGKGFQILHFGSIVFNPLATIGENCTVFPGVIIGQDKRGLAPNIGNKVFIGANSIVVGGISIGNNCLIAPGSYVNFDVPDNCLVIGNPARYFVKNKEIINGYLNNLI
jgi:serine O-acetyltransferase